ncbi:hypothetical protein CC2G_006196 [Coprinopsis cinerea AmutBmut pab1-1]|nr:hypothetical protein CC2G_006196 [Coprinopsis cinerea AmutBmut pab1-1]
MSTLYSPTTHLPYIINVLGQSEDVLYTVNMKYRGALCWSGLPSDLAGAQQYNRSVWLVGIRLRHSRKVSRKDPPRTVWKAKLKGSLVSNKMLPPVCLIRTQKTGLGKPHKGQITASGSSPTYQSTYHPYTQINHNQPNI